MNSDIENFLSQYIDLSENMISLFKEIITYIELEPIDFLPRTNENSTSFFIVKTGIVRSYLQSESGKEITRTFFLPGQLTGNIAALIKKAPSNLNYQALTKITAYKGDFFKFKELVLKHHKLSLLYVKTLESTYLKTESLILEISTYSATERYLMLKKIVPDIDNIIAQRYIASYLNVSPVQLSRIKKNLSILQLK
jgi:CRP-like cAMP-binding protein